MDIMTNSWYVSLSHLEYMASCDNSLESWKERKENAFVFALTMPSFYALHAKRRNLVALWRAALMWAFVLHGTIEHFLAQCISHMPNLNIQYMWVNHCNKCTGTLSRCRRKFMPEFMDWKFSRIYGSFSRPIALLLLIGFVENKGKGERKVEGFQNHLLMEKVKRTRKWKEKISLFFHLRCSKTMINTFVLDW